MFIVIFPHLNEKSFSYTRSNYSDLAYEKKMLSTMMDTLYKSSTIDVL